MVPNRPWLASVLSADSGPTILSDLHRARFLAPGPCLSLFFHLTRLSLLLALLHSMGRQPAHKDSEDQHRLLESKKEELVYCLARSGGFDYKLLQVRRVRVAPEYSEACSLRETSCDLQKVVLVDVQQLQRYLLCNLDELCEALYLQLHKYRFEAEAVDDIGEAVALAKGILSHKALREADRNSVSSYHLSRSTQALLLPTMHSSA